MTDGNKSNVIALKKSYRMFITFANKRRIFSSVYYCNILYIQEVVTNCIYLYTI